jgi:RNA polymerase sigma factor (sigma-70 family)
VLTPCIESWVRDVELGGMSEIEDVVSETAVARSFADFYRLELSRQVRRAALLTGSAELAHDLVHDAFVEIYRRWDQIDQPGPYLNRAVLNRCRDAGRARTRRDRVLSTLVADDTAWDREPIADLLDGLPFNQRAVVVLRFYVGLGNAEIADVLGCRPGSVGPWLDRALKQLRKVM